MVTRIYGVLITYILTTTEMYSRRTQITPLYIGVWLVTTMVSYQTRKIIDKSEQKKKKHRITASLHAVKVRLKYNINILYIYIYSLYNAYYTICHKHHIYIYYRWVSYWVTSNSLVFYSGQTFFPELKI